MREAERRHLELLCAPLGIQVDDVYPRPVGLFDTEYYDDRLDRLTGLRWATQFAASERQRPAYGWVLLLRGPEALDEEVLRDLARRISVTFPQIRYVAYRSTEEKQPSGGLRTPDAMTGKSRTARIAEVCEQFGLTFELKQAEDDTIVLLLKGRRGLARVVEAERQLREIIEDDWLIMFEPSDVPPQD